jgi:Cu(I)/Ag(I) efflux system membrane fusion protein
VRVNLENPDGRLKPDMFVKAVVRSQVVADGRVISPDLAGKWISPMHPEIVRDEPGACPVCGMDLVSAESLGYVPAGMDASALPLVIPATAPLITGKRAVVYVAVIEQPGRFEGRVIELGPRAGDRYLVRSGLREGELVVTQGAFKIDSAVQILARPSMMNPVEEPGAATDEGGGWPIHLAPAAFQEQLRAVVDRYLPIAQALSRDDLAGAQGALAPLSSALVLVDLSQLKGAAQLAWTRELERIDAGAAGLGSAAEIEAARVEFEGLSNGLIGAIDDFGLAGPTAVYVYRCPMAFKNRGADWLQGRQGTENPYFGSRMFRCGEEMRELTRGGRIGVGPDAASPGGHQH